MRDYKSMKDYARNNFYINDEPTPLQNKIMFIVGFCIYAAICTLEYHS